MYENEDSGNEQANGANNRFEGLDNRFKKGGNPRAFMVGPEICAAMMQIATFANTDESYIPSATSADGSLLQDLSTLDVCREMKAVKDAKEAADLIAKELGRQYDFLRLALVPTKFEEDGVSNLKIGGVGRVNLRGEIFAGILSGKQEAAFEWLDDNGRGDIVKRTVNSSSLKATLKGMLAKGEEFPAELFKAEPYTMAVITRG